MIRFNFPSKYRQTDISSPKLIINYVHRVCTFTKIAKPFLENKYLKFNQLDVILSMNGYNFSYKVYISIGLVGCLLSFKKILKLVKINYLLHF